MQIIDGKILLNQSFVKSLGLYYVDQLYHLDVCPKQVYYVDVIEKYKREESEAMQYGVYGETLLLGGGAKGKALWDLPRKKLTKNQQVANREAQRKGNPPVYEAKKKKVQQRIEEQVELFRIKAKKMGIYIHDYNSQVQLTRHWRDRYYLTGEYDIFPSTIYVKDLKGYDDGPVLIGADIKFTHDVHNSFFNPNNVAMTSISCYGNPGMLIKNQILFYHWIGRNIDRDLNYELHSDYTDKYDVILTDQVIRLLNETDWLFYLFVMSYGKDISNTDDHQKFLPFAWNSQKEAALDELVEQAIRNYEYFESIGWKANPSVERCSKCPLREMCDEAKLKEVY